MRNIISLLFLSFIFVSCNSSEPNSTTGNSQDSTTVNQDNMSDTRGQKGAGVDNSGGTSGSGTLTDTARGKTDTLDHNSKKEN